jgi:hypothetical protein
MKNDFFDKFLITVISGVWLLSAAPALGDATVYWTLDDGFSPTTVVIGPNEAVTWWNIDYYNLDTHVYFDNGNNFALPNGSGVGVTFNVGAGVYGYQDQIGDRATVIVNVAPTVTITAPPDNAVFAAPATFTVAATASDTADDAISDVEFFLGTSDGTNSIEDVYSAPYTTGFTNLDAGTYTLIAVARDSRGATAADAITITVTSAAGPISLSSPRMDTGKFLFDVTGLTAGKTNIVEVSADLMSWTPATTNLAASAAMTVTNDATDARQFYRVLQLP